MFEPSAISTSGEHRDLPVEPNGIIPELTADVAVEDWELLLGAVKARLRSTATEPSNSSEGQHDNPAAKRIRTSVLERMGALDQLHETLRLELIRSGLSSARQLGMVLHRGAGNGMDELRPQLFDSGSRLAVEAVKRAGADKNRFVKRLARSHSDVNFGGRSGVLLLLKLGDPNRLDLPEKGSAMEAMFAFVSARLTQAVRSKDSVGRIEQDEFACLLSDCTLRRDQLAPRARTLFEAVSAPFSNDRLEATLGASMGGCLVAS